MFVKGQKVRISPNSVHRHESKGTVGIITRKDIDGGEEYAYEVEWANEYRDLHRGMDLLPVLKDYIAKCK